MNWETINKETLVSENYAYFDTGAAAPPPASVIQKVKRYLDETAEEGIYLPSLRQRVYQDIEKTRGKLAAFIGATAEEIAFTKNGTESICIVAQGIDWKAGDEVILPDTEMLSNISVWLQLEKQRGIKVIRAKANREGLLDAQTIKAFVTDKTRLISFVALSNVTGAVQPVADICRMAKTRNILTHVNAAQALGMLDIDVQDWQCDFLSASGRKGLRGIEGSGVLFVSADQLEQVTPCLIGWWNSSIDSKGEVVLPATAKRFEAGCPNTPAIYSLDAALDYANGIGQSAISERSRQLTAYAISRLKTIEGFELYGPQNIADRVSMIPFNIQGVDPKQLVAALERRKIIIEAGHFMASSILQSYNIDCMARASVHYFNTEAEIDRLVSSIIEIKGE